MLRSSVGPPIDLPGEFLLGRLFEPRIRCAHRNPLLEVLDAQAGELRRFDGIGA